MREFKVGDKVVSKSFGNGEVTQIDAPTGNPSNDRYPIGISFLTAFEWCTREGQYWSDKKDIDKDIKYIEDTMKQITQAEVFTEFARVAKLIEDTDLKLIDVFRYDNEKPKFEYSYEDSMLGDYDKYTFALALVESKPVFAGDKLWSTILKNYYTITGITRNHFLTKESDNLAGTFKITNCTWKQPKKTFTINGIELPLPDDKEGGYSKSGYCFIDKYMLDMYRWDDCKDRDKVLKVITDLLDGGE